MPRNWLCNTSIPTHSRLTILLYINFKISPKNGQGLLIDFNMQTLCGGELLYLFLKELVLIHVDNLHRQPFHGKGHSTKVKAQGFSKILFYRTLYVILSYYIHL